jgi:hypothetical protein
MRLWRVVESQRDLAWDAIATVAERLNARAAQDDRWDERERLVVKGKRQRLLATWTVREGLYFGNLSTYGFEVVRERRFFGRRWTEKQSVAEAASRVGSFLRIRPDLTGGTWPPESA